MKIEKFCPPLNDELLKKYNFFELYPFDGGGCFIHSEIIGTVDDGEIYDRIVNDGALSDFGNLPSFDFGRFERWRSIEKSCWINRFYFIVPLAKKYWLTKNEEIAVTVKNTILYFIRNFRPPATKDAVGEHQKRVFYNRDTNYNSKSYDEYSKDESDVEYIWFDFQPASRIIHFLYAFYFLKDSKSVSESEWIELERGIDEHARTIMYGEKYFAQLAKGNHQSLRGLALLYAAAFLGNDEYALEGVRICDYHIRNDFLPDGVLHEISPSYHIFETWHVRDSYLLSKAYKLGLCKESSGVLARAGLFAGSLSQPDGKSTVVNDGYALSLEGFIASLPGNKNISEYSSASFFKNAGLAFFRDESRYLFLDASPFTGAFSHYHAGKNSLTFWQDGKPFLIDNGCCNYDDPLFAKWFKKADAHSSLLVDGHGDGTLEGTYNWQAYSSIDISGWMEASDGTMAIKSELTSSAEGWSALKWERNIAVKEKNETVLSDTVSGADGCELCFIFNLHPDVVISNKAADHLILANGEVRLEISFESQSQLRITEADSLSFVDFKKCENKQLRIYLKASSSSIRMETIIKAF